MATAETIQATEPDADTDWTAEIELRRHLRSELPESDKDNQIYPAAPDPARAEYFEPDDTHSDHCHNDELRSLEGIEVSDDRIIVPLETARELRGKEATDNSHDALDELLLKIINHMRIVESTTRNGTRYNLIGPDGGYADSETHDPSKTDPRPIYVRVPKDDHLNKLQRLYEDRKENGRTLLVIVIARDAATGTGKTTLACQLAKDWDTHGWSAERATLSPGEYADQYTDSDTPSKSVLLLDEAEQAADNRRSMSNQNVKLSHLWATMRFREIYSIITLPSASMLDKRLKELADVKIIVHNRGTAVAYKTKIDDHSGEYRAKRLCRLRWNSLDDDPDFQQVTEEKAERMNNYAETFSYGGDDDDPDPEEVRQDYRLQVIERMSAAGYTQSEIADALPDVTDRSTISKILSEN